jgi:HAD superfamily hydrolase (TIGR01549 family)
LPREQIKAVFFDLGETLLSFGRIDSGRLFKEAAELSYSFLRQLGQKVGSFKLYFLRNLVSIRVHYLLSNIIGRDFDSLALLKKLGRKWQLQLSEEQWQQLAWLWYEPLSKIVTIETNIIETLEKLKNAGLKLGIVSNTFVHSSTLDRHLAQLGLLDYFPMRIYSYNCAFRKPDRRIFQMAADKVGEEPARSMFVGDRLDYDIKGALKARMRPVLKKAYTNNGKKIPKGVLRINSLSELPEVIEKINTQITRHE